MTTLIDETTTAPDEIDILITAALDATRAYEEQIGRLAMVRQTPDLTAASAAYQALYEACGKLLDTRVTVAARRVRLAKAEVYATDFSDEAEASYADASDALWGMLMDQLGDTLPRVTIRHSSLGKSGDAVAIVLFHEPDGRLSYRRAFDQGLLFGPGTEAHMRECLLHPGWKP